MEVTELLIARLVLGYLKRKKYRTAHKELLRASTHLQQTNLFRSKYVPTRVSGLTLEEILSEYFEICNLVHGRIEATNYYDECNSKTSLVEQVLYLINKVQLSRSPTPCPRSPPDSNLDETSPSHADQNSDVETTPAHTLPGNVRSTSENSYLHKTSRRKSHSKFNKSDTASAIPAADREDMSEVLAQTLLENREFHEKIAQTINKVAEKQYRELDETVKTVVKETEEDPIFDRILEEIIESTTIADASKAIETSSTSSSNAKNTNKSFDNRSKRIHQGSESTENEDQHYKSYSESRKVEEQNNEAIRSIIANSKLASNTQINETQTNSEVIVFDGPLDKYLITNPCNTYTQAQSIQNPLYINASGGLLMVPSTANTNAAANLQIDTSKQIYFVNKAPAINWSMPLSKTPSIITEQDILTMPTVIVNEEKGKRTADAPALQTPVLTTVNNSTFQPIIPKPMIEIPAEYYPLYNGHEQQRTGLKNVIYPKTTKKKQKPAAKSKSDDSSVNEAANTVVPNITRSLSSDLLNEDQHSEAMNHMKFETHKQINQQPENRTQTPPLQESVQKITPKSGSHVRNLDFSTPPKITSTHEKVVRTQDNKSPSFVHKKQAAKTLFKSQDKALRGKVNSEVAIQAKSDTKKRNTPSLTTWDAELRAIIPPVENVKQSLLQEVTPKRKRKSPVKKSKRSKKKVDKEVEEQLNSTEHEAALLEAALQTPIKTEKEDLKTTEVNESNDKIKETSCMLENEQRKSNSINKVSFERKVTETNWKMGVCQQEGTAINEDNSNKMILSPSKLNASKRNLVNINIATCSIAGDAGNIDLKLPDKKDKFITPEMVKDNVHYPIKANRNILPMLNTPLKHEHLPKTPGIETPMNHVVDPNLSITSSTFTPFTKMLEENLKGVDINTIPTPNIPITPSFPPFTPTVDLVSPYSNRPTDYSTSSSYYQPSDNEQNKSLEANVIELEKKPIKILDNVTVENGDFSDSKICKDVITTDQNKSSSTTVNEHLNIFNKSVIGKKNLNLVNRDISHSSSSSDDSPSGSSSEEDVDSAWEEKESNDTVIYKIKSVETPKRTYSLRNRTTVKTHNKDESNKKLIEQTKSKINKKLTSTEVKVSTKQSTKIIPKLITKSEKSNVDEVENKQVIFKEQIVNIKSTGLSTFQRAVFKELEEKRLRTIDKVKSVEKITSKKSSAKLPVKQSTGKFMKIKPIPNLTNSRRKLRKSQSPKKTTRVKTVKVSSNTSKNSFDGETTDDDLLLSSSEDEESGSKISCKAKKSIKNADKTERSASDVEAQNLIEGLKERGIHLMHNKSSPIKKDSGTSDESKAEIKEVKTTKNADSTECVNSIKDDTTKTIGESTSLEIRENEQSTTELVSELRDMYDTKLFEKEDEYVVFEETKNVNKTFEDYDIDVLKKTFIGKVFVEEINKEVDVPLAFTPFYILLDIPSSVDLKVQEQKTSLQNNEANSRAVQLEKICKRKESLEKDNGNKKESHLIKDVLNPTACDEAVKSDDDLMNYAIIGSAREETPEGSDSPKSTRKRKLRSEDNSHTEKKCKTLLKKINVDSFLNNIHGET